MIHAIFSENTKTKAIPLTWCRVTELNYDSGFYFRCSNGHLSLFKPPAVKVSNSKGIEGTVNKELICDKLECSFKSHVVLNNWKFNFAVGVLKVKK